MTLTKSRFVLATECATKLYYKDNSREYVDRSLDDDFLLALAEGGFQVGALARVVYGGGVLIEGGSLDDRLRRTTELLQHDTVTIYEAVIRAGELLVVVDVLRKQGTTVDLMEVKAKSYDPADDGDLRSKKMRTLAGAWVPYLYDIAFQVHVFHLAWPKLEARPFLVLVDKTTTTTVDGLNARFKVRRTADHRSAIEVTPGTDAAAIGASLLRALHVHEQVEELLAVDLRVGESWLPFPQAVDALRAAHLENRRIWSPPSRRCVDCQFRAAPDGARRSGFRECWAEAYGWRDVDFDEPSVLDLWKFSGKDDLIRDKKLKLHDVTEDDLGRGADQDSEGGLTDTGRHKLQVRRARERSAADWFEAAGFAQARSEWTWPLNFIDFETCMVAVPFTRGRRPYEQVAFQFSHHVRHADGRVEHAAQYIDVRPGQFPNYGFVRALRNALMTNGGTIFRWHSHENSVLRAIRTQLAADLDNVPDRGELIAFIDWITHWNGDDGEPASGMRNMVDLCDVAKRFYFDPATNGSSSLKKVLPALMRTSTRLRQRYGVPVYGIGCEIPSLNFDVPVAWWEQKNGHVVDPYDLLPPIFDDVTLEEQHHLEWAQEFALPKKLREGGAAMTAYARLQFEDMHDDARQAVERALLKYCELDTLAMVMAVEAWEARI